MGKSVVWIVDWVAFQDGKEMDVGHWNYGRGPGQPADLRHGLYEDVHRVLEAFIADVERNPEKRLSVTVTLNSALWATVERKGVRHG
jgi:hypothetical protein